MIGNIPFKFFTSDEFKQSQSILKWPAKSFDSSEFLLFELSIIDCEFHLANLFSLLQSGGKFAFSIYDFEGNETMDMFYLGDCLRALNLNPTLAQIEKMGGTKKKGIRSYFPA